MYEETYWLNVYPNLRGQWAGRVSKGDELIRAIDGCSSADQVEAIACDQFDDIEEVVRSYGPP